MNLEIARRAFSYDNKTGLLHWREPSSRHIKVGAVAGYNDGHGYRRVCFKGRTLAVHRVIWLIHMGEWPKSEVDHIDGNPANNRIENLRLATHAQNLANTKLRSDNSSGLKGVSFDDKRRTWCAQIRISGKKRGLGRFPTKEEAYAAYCEASEKHHGEYARLR